MTNFVSVLTGMVWGIPIVVLILGVGVYFSIRLGFPQLRCLKDMIAALRSGKQSGEGLSTFQVFVFTAARSVGVGNIAGMATAIYYGGPGALFWLWFLAFFGTNTALIEGTLAQTYKTVMNGQYVGGPAYYLEKGIRNRKIGRFVALCFAGVTVISVSVLMTSVQSHNIVKGIHDAFGVSILAGGCVFTLFIAVVIFGGLKRIGQVVQRISPVMAVAYVLMTLVVVGMNITKLPDVFLLIVRSAFGMDQVFSGIVGYAVVVGVKRGLFANEVGQGTSAITAASAEVSHPVKQGLSNALSVYIGTLLVCTSTAFMVLITDSYNVMGPDGAFIVQYVPALEYGNPYVSHAINSVLPGIGQIFVALSVLFFAYVALLAYYYGSRPSEYHLIG